MPSGDILIHAGDFSMFSKSSAAIEDFNNWLGELSFRHVIVVPGNHEFFLEADVSKRQMLTNATLLIDEGVEVLGLKIWGSPVTPLYGGAFGRSSSLERAKLYARIPTDVDVLVTHGPPYGVLDSTPASTQHSGCPELLKRVEQIKPMLHVFGHIHGAYGMKITDETLFINAALLGFDGDLYKPPRVIRIARKP